MTLEKMAMRDAFGEALVKMGKKNRKIVVLDADVSSSTRTVYFKRAFPNRFFNIGIAEQNMVGVAAGLATIGFIPVVSSFSFLLSMRAAEQIRTLAAYPKLNVKFAGGYSGLSNSFDGVTHQSVEDIAIMRAMPNMVVIEPADGLELRQALKAAVFYQGPVYFRVVRCQLPDILPLDYQFKLGKGTVLRHGSDISLIGSGLMTSRCLEAAEILSDEGISARVINLSTLKPIDEGIIIQAAKETEAIVTAENHSIIGGLGSAVSEVLSEHCPVPVKRIGINDSFGESGKLEDLLKKFGLTSVNVIEAARELLKRKK